MSVSATFSMSRVMPSWILYSSEHNHDIYTGFVLNRSVTQRLILCNCWVAFFCLLLQQAALWNAGLDLA